MLNVGKECSEHEQYVALNLEETKLEVAKAQLEFARIQVHRKDFERGNGRSSKSIKN